MDRICGCIDTQQEPGIYSRSHKTFINSAVLELGRADRIFRGIDPGCQRCGDSWTQYLTPAPCHNIMYRRSGQSYFHRQLQTRNPGADQGCHSSQADCIFFQGLLEQILEVFLKILFFLHKKPLLHYDCERVGAGLATLSAPGDGWLPGPPHR